MVVNEDYDESIREGETNFDPFGSFADTLIDEMMVDEITNKFDAEVNYLASTDDAKLMRRAMGEINLGIDGDSEVFDLLERINSRFIYHLNPKDFSPRESVCAYLNTICSWSVLLQDDGSHENDCAVYVLKDIYSEYQEYVKNSLYGFPFNKRMKMKDFEAYIDIYCDVRKRDQTFEGERLRGTSICGLPQEKVWQS